MSEVVIDLETIKDNTKKIVDKYSSYKHFIAVVKTDAYGLGYNIIPSLVEGGVNYLAVSYLDEALKIRDIDKKTPILCLQPIDADKLNDAFVNDVTITVSSLDYLKTIINKINRSIKVHVKVDSGMNRLGFKTSSEFNEAIDLIKSNRNITLEGIYTHFATVGYIDPLYDESVNKFKEITSSINLEEVPIVHFGGSAALIAHNKLSFVNGFRSGILFLGYNISLADSNIGFKNKLRHVRDSFIRSKYKISETIKNVELDIKNPVRFNTRVIEIKKVNAGEYIGYGAGYMAGEDSLIAILPVGRANGIKNSSDRYVIINGKKYYAVGEISMNMMSVIVDKDVKIGDEVELMGDNISLGEYASFNSDSLSDTLINFRNNNRIYR